MRFKLKERAWLIEQFWSKSDPGHHWPITTWSCKLLKLCIISSWEAETANHSQQSYKQNPTYSAWDGPLALNSSRDHPPKVDWTRWSRLGTGPATTIANPEAQVCKQTHRVLTVKVRVQEPCLLGISWNRTQVRWMNNTHQDASSVEISLTFESSQHKITARVRYSEAN